jgi:predicted dithiol-disulfide oxidoreductase (DUF899 family)
MATVVSREEWLAARTDLQKREDETWVAIQKLNADRQEMPWVEIDKDYQFQTESGPKSLLDLFDGREQLIIYHFMFHPEWNQGCQYCSLNMDAVGPVAHLRARKTNFVVISRAPIDKIAAFRKRMGWDFEWVSSEGSDFNADFYATLDGTAEVASYMYKSKEAIDAEGGYYFEKGDQGGVSVFIRKGDRIFHTYSSFGTAPDILVSMANYLDLTPLGRVDAPVKHHDKY